MTASPDETRGRKVILKVQAVLASKATFRRYHQGLMFTNRGLVK